LLLILSFGFGFCFLNAQNEKAQPTGRASQSRNIFSSFAKLPDSACRPSPTKLRDPLDGSASVTILS
jgi:hypothetical protein